MSSTKLALRKETLTELTTDELSLVVGGLAAIGNSCFAGSCITNYAVEVNSCVAASCVTN